MTSGLVRRVAGLVLASAFAAACATAAGPRPAPFPGAPASTSPAPERAPAAPESAEPLRATSPVAARLIESAVALVGTRYRFGGQSPETGFDCSGLVSYVAALHGIALPRTTAAQYGAGDAVDRDELEAGDLVFFSTIGPGATHVGIVISTGAEPRFVHAPADGASVRIERFDTPYWQTRWIGARRIISTNN